jgi:hypothetical protein
MIRGWLSVAHLPHPMRIRARLNANHVRSIAHFTIAVFQESPLSRHWFCARIGGDMRTNPCRPDIIVPIDDVWEGKLRALNVHASQHLLGYKKYIVRRTVHYDMLGRTNYAEGFYLKQPLVFSDIRALLR